MVVLIAREARQVEHNYEMDTALVQATVREQALELAAVGRLGALAFFMEAFDDLVALPAAVLFARAKQALPRDTAREGPCAAPCLLPVALGFEGCSPTKISCVTVTRPLDAGEARIRSNRSRSADARGLRGKVRCPCRTGIDDLILLAECSFDSEWEGAFPG